PHDVDTFEFVRTVFFEDRRILHGIFVRPRSAVDIPGTRIPGCWRIRVIVLDLAFLDYDVMGKHSTYGLVESATDRFVRHFKLGPCFVAAGTYFVQCPFAKVQCSRSCISLEVRARSRSMALLHFGMCHSNCVSGNSAVFGRLILTLCPVAWM